MLRIGSVRDDRPDGASPMWNQSFFDSDALREAIMGEDREFFTETADSAGFVGERAPDQRR